MGSLSNGCRCSQLPYTFTIYAYLTHIALAAWPVRSFDALPDLEMPVIHPALPSSRALARHPQRPGPARPARRLQDKAAAPPALARRACRRHQVGVLRDAGRGRSGQRELPGWSRPRAWPRCARAAGILRQRLLGEGSDVKGRAGTVRDRCRPLPGGVRQCPTGLARAQANLDRSQRAGRALPAAGCRQTISQQEFINAAGRAAAGAGRQRQWPGPRCRPAHRCRYRERDGADLGPHRARAGHRGRAGRPGRAAAGAIQQIDPVYVNFTQSADVALRGVGRAVEAGQLKGRIGQRQRMRVCSTTAASMAAARQAAVLRSERRRRQRQVTLRAEVPNPRADCCCRACSCGCGSSRPGPTTRSCCRSRRSRARNRATA